MAEYGRQGDPQPLNRQGELAFVLLSSIVFAVAWVAVGGLGVACAVFGGGWVFPEGGDQVIAVTAGLLSGHPGRGLPPEIAAQVPGPIAVYACVVMAEVVAIGAAAFVAVLVSRYRRPADARRGMATRYEASQILGIRRLRRARAVIRPDLVKIGSKTSDAAELEDGHDDRRLT